MLHLKPFVLLLVACCVIKRLTIVSAQECILSNTECTCAEQGLSGPCVSPVAASTDMCSGGDCDTSYKCDCLGYEKCTISKCGKWSPADNALISRTTNFQCSYEPGISMCQTQTGLMLGPNAAQNAEQAAIAYSYQSGREEAAASQIFADITTLKDQSFDMLRKATLLGEEVLGEEAIECEIMNARVDEIAAELVLVGHDFASALEQATKTYDAIRLVRICTKLSRDAQHGVDDRDSRLNDAKEAADKAGVTCTTCATLISEKDALMKEHLLHRDAIVTYAASSRDARQEMKEKRISMQNRHEKVKGYAASVSSLYQDVRQRLG